MATTSHIATTPQVEVAALNEYIKKKTEPINRKSIVWAGFEQNGRISFNHDGQQMEWRPRFRRRRISTGAGNVASILFPQTVVNTKCTLPWRVYDLGESLTKFARLATAGKSGWFKLAKEMYDQLSGDFIADLATKVYSDGNSTTSPDNIHGFESWFSVNSTVTNSPVGNPNDSYAGQATTLGVTGSWTAETGWGWPTGVGYEEYHWFSPLVVDYNNTLFNGTTANFSNQWQEALSWGLTYLMTLQNTTPDITVWSPRLVTQMKQSLQSSQRFTTSDNSLVKLGHKMLNYEGTDIAWEYGIPEAVGYGWAWENLEVRSMQRQLIGYSEDHDIKTSQDLFALDSYLQMRCESPAFTLKWEGISTAGT